MSHILKIFPWKRGTIISLVVLFLGIIFSFYGLYTNTFFLFKISNYILPLVTIVHFLFLYVLWFKIKEDEIADPQMRNLEYALYALLPIYLYKLVSTILVLAGSSEFVGHSLPWTFYPVCIFMILVYTLLIGVTFLAVAYRIKHVGGYNFEEMNRIDSWE